VEDQFSKVIVSTVCFGNNTANHCLHHVGRGRRGKAWRWQLTKWYRRGSLPRSCDTIDMVLACGQLSECGSFGSEEDASPTLISLDSVSLMACDVGIDVGTSLNQICLRDQYDSTRYSAAIHTV
jgi:hypothetical protein